MSHFSTGRATILLLILGGGTICAAADVFLSRHQKAGFMRALAGRHARYDPAEKMIRRPFSSPGYHTTLKGGYVHPTRDSLNYAVALLDSGEPDLLGRAEQILRRVISLQDQEPDSRTYGIWSWFLEEPLDKMSPPDWNWADFCGTQLLQVAIDHMHRLADDLKLEVKQSILHAAYSIKRRNVGPGYTNIALMGTYVTLVAGELFEVDELTEYGKARLKRFHHYTLEQGSFREYNSPTYTVVAIKEITRMLGHVRDPDSQKLLRDLNRRAWFHVARRYHPPTRQWAGPHSRCYRTLLSDSTLAFIQRATGDQVHLVPEGLALESLDAHRLIAECPSDFFHHFTDPPERRLEIETFARGGAGGHDIIGTTYMHPDFTLGSVNIGDLWNQRRPLLAYWKTETGVAAMRLRCLHDGYDYASASLFAVQDKADILGAVVFATDRGDTHISLDRIKDATIKAKDLRLRLQFEGATDDIELPSRAKVGEAVCLSAGRVTCAFHVPHAAFEERAIEMQTGQDDETLYIDVVLYTGPERDLNFAKISEAAAIFALSVRQMPPPQHLTPQFNFGVSSAAGAITAVWKRNDRTDMTLTIPARPTRTRDQQSIARAEFGSDHPWKAGNRRPK
ncbi:MAG: hypothetical protein JSU70_22165 [Phycisphaerales bacterium]|nr:MAG: hypothetical protein JSU70_22165 [Phycisphaerales bacterium]